MAEKRERKEGGLGRYFKNVRIELKKVVWPSKEELVKYSILVMILSTIASLFIYFFDFIIHSLLQLIIG